MSKRNEPSLVVIAAGLCFTVWAQVAAAQSAAPAKKSMTDSPYKDGPPPTSGGYTDTTQGGSHTSGEMPLPPQVQQGNAPSGGQAQKQQADPQKPNPQAAEPAS